MKALVVGCGSIGTRHIENLLDHDHVSDVFGLDITTAAAQNAAEEYDIWTTTNPDAAWDRSPDMVFVCTPPHTHIQLAETSLANDTHVFIEKPLADSLDSVPGFLEQAEDSDQVCMVGCNMRFHPPVVKIREWLSTDAIGRLEYIQLQYGNHLSNWRSGDLSDQYTAQADKGGGIILDGIHEIDLLLEWLSEPNTVQSAAGTYSDLPVDVEDTAELLIEGSNQLGSVHLDFIRPERARTYELIGADGLIRWEARGKNPEKSEVGLYQMDTEMWTRNSYESNLNEMYVSELEHFIDCIQTGSSPAVGVTKGRDALASAVAARQAARSGNRQHLNADSYKPD
jgi:predicted dehydrogenase